MTAPQMQQPVEVQRVVAASRRTAYHPNSRIARFLLWPLWPLLDVHTGRPSGPKCMAWAILGACASGHQIAAAIAVILLATMFGVKSFDHAVDKATLGLTSSDSVNVALKRERTEATTTTTTNVNTHYTVDGSGASVPAMSLPPVVGAMTPSGEG